jgi:hypothetical protein
VRNVVWFLLWFTWKMKMSLLLISGKIIHRFRYLVVSNAYCLESYNKGTNLPIGLVLNPTHPEVLESIWSYICTWLVKMLLSPMCCFVCINWFLSCNILSDHAFLGIICAVYRSIIIHFDWIICFLLLLQKYETRISACMSNGKVVPPKTLFTDASFSCFY